tara:strand:+ start:150 stop:434 length:285 start_codon:yes stop_codon:yes gene_type:complete
MSEKKNIDSLKKKIDENQKSIKINKNINKNKSGLSFGLRIGVELVSALLVSVVIGIYVDKYLGTKPFGLIIFFILGSLAGFLNVYRVMRRIEKE